MTEGQLKEARQYRRRALVCALADRGIDVLFLAMMALLFARPIDAWLQSFPVLDRLWWLRFGAFLLILTALHAMVSFPLSYYADYALEHRFGLSTLSLRGWLWRYAKVVVLSTVMGLVIWTGLYGIIRATGPWWWLTGALAFFLVSIVLARLYPVLIQPLFYTIQRLDRPDLHERLIRLAEGTGLTIEGVYRIAFSEETKKANAQLAGLGKTRRVLLGDTLLDHFTREEIEVIFAHEIGHHVFHHIRKMVCGSVVVSAAAFWLIDIALRWWITVQEGRFDYASLPVHALPALLLMFLVFGLCFGPIQNAVSRHFERQCDRYALRRTGLREAYVSAFRKLAAQNKSDPDPPRLQVILFNSHPPIAERLAMAEQEGP